MALPSTEALLGLSRRGRLQALRHGFDELMRIFAGVAAHLKLLARIGKRDGRPFANWSVLER